MADYEGCKPETPCAWLIQALRRKINFTFSPCSQIVKSKERWQSGRMCLTRNQVAGQPARGFESLPLRHFDFGFSIFDCGLIKNLRSVIYFNLELNLANCA